MAYSVHFRCTVRAADLLRRPVDSHDLDQFHRHGYLCFRGAKGSLVRRRVRSLTLIVYGILSIGSSVFQVSDVVIRTGYEGVSHVRALCATVRGIIGGVAVGRNMTLPSGFARCYRASSRGSLFCRSGTASAASGLRHLVRSADALLACTAACKRLPGMVSSFKVLTAVFGRRARVDGKGEM